MTVDIRLLNILYNTFVFKPASEHLHIYIDSNNKKKSSNE